MKTSVQDMLFWCRRQTGRVLEVRFNLLSVYNNLKYMKHEIMSGCVVFQRK